MIKILNNSNVHTYISIVKKQVKLIQTSAYLSSIFVTEYEEDCDIYWAGLLIEQVPPEARDYLMTKAENAHPSDKNLILRLLQRLQGL